MSASPTSKGYVVTSARSIPDFYDIYRYLNFGSMLDTFVINLPNTYRPKFSVEPSR